MSNRVRIRPPAKPDTSVIPGKAILGYLHPGQVEGGFMRSALNLIAYDGIHNRRLIDGGLQAHLQSPVISCSQWPTSLISKSI